MSRSNNKQNKNKKLNKIVNENKQTLNYVRSINNKLKKSNTPQIRTKKGVKSYVNKNLGFRNIMSNASSINQFQPFTRRYASLLKNPIHSNRPCKLPDLNTNPSLTFNDYIVTLGNTTIDIATVAASPVSQAVIFYFSYGPTGLLLEATGDHALYPWRVFGIPINSSGQPIKNDNGTVLTPTIMTNANTNAILALVTQVRLIAGGLRVNSMNELTTNTDTQFVESFVAGQMKLKDFESWYVPGNKDITPFILQQGDNAVFKNAEGASSRYCPFQANHDYLTSYFEDGVLTSTADNNNWNSEQLYFPYIYVKMHEDADVTTLDMKDYRPLFNKNQEKKQEEMFTRLIRRELKEDDDFEDSPPVEHVFVEKVLNGRTILVPKNVGDPVTYHITYPIRLEVKYWTECQVAIPTPLNIAKSPSEPNWDRFMWWINDSANFPRFTNGHSFNGFIRGATRFARKNLTRRKVRNGFNYATGMIGDVRTGLTDLSNSLY